MIVAFNVKKISFEEDPVQGRYNLIGQIRMSKSRGAGFKFDKNAEEDLLNLDLKKPENIGKLKTLQSELMSYYANRAHNIHDEANETLSKLNLIIFDFSLIDDYNDATIFMLETENSNLWEKGDFDINAFVVECGKKITIVNAKMRNELSQMLKITDFNELQERFVMLNK